MRPAFSFIDTFARHNLLLAEAPAQTPLIAYTDLGYDRQFMPVSVLRQSGDCVTNSGEAEMDQNRSNRTKPIQNDEPSSEQLPETREQKLARIKAEIEAGVYETPEKMEIALSRMLGVIAD